MNTSSEHLDGHLVFSIATTSDEDAREQLMRITGQFLDTLDHVSRFHLAVITPGYVWDIFDDLGHMQLKHGWPAARPD